MANTLDSDAHDAAQTPDFHVVGIGASAGGIKALTEFFAHVPARSRMAYVVILHLSPEHDSRLAEVLRQSTEMPVTQVTETTRIEPEHVYVIPPNKSLTMRDSTLVLNAVTGFEERRAPVDIFFRTLAETHLSRAVSVVLSGTGADGSMGMKRVKERGGICFVQDPREAEYADMPRHSIATGLVDYVLPVAQMPARIIAYKERLAGNNPSPQTPEPMETDEKVLRDIFTQLRLRTGHDFSNYKRTTLMRRLDRRIGVREVTDLAAYACLLREQPAEAQALMKDLLISVTNFFRDREMFGRLERDIIPRMFADKAGHDYVRVWVAGCATGEEAYSMAMLLHEHAATKSDAPTLQVFATDLDEAAVTHAREGLYTLNDVADVSPERLRRFFVRDAENFRVRRELRETVLFAVHNLIKDPPFSHLDLVSCRNLLIYLNRTAQERLMDVFSFALNPGGFLFLGSAETIDGAGDLFVTLDKEARIYQSRDAAARKRMPLTEFAATPHVETRLPADRTAERRTPERPSYGDLHYRLIEQYAPPSIVVNDTYDILHLSERAGRFLQIAGGEPSFNLLRVVRPELRLELRTALIRAAQRNTNTEARGLSVKLEDRTATVNLVVRPVPRESDAARGFFLVLFEEQQRDPRIDAAQAATEETTEETGSEVVPIAAVARQMEEELTRTKTQLSHTIEQYETSGEELRASNEELQALNEELRSAAEELETSKEEMQSVNEELTTVNQELKIKVEELSHANSDIQNLVNSTDIATIFLDRRLRVKVFTPRTRDLFNLIPADEGRPLSDITHKLLYDDLLTDAERVQDSLQLIEREVATRDERLYLMRLAPYRTLEDRIDGVVLNFVDITERKRAEDAVRASEARQSFLVKLGDALRPLSDPLEIQRTAMRVLGEHLQADRVLYSEIELDDRHFVIADNYARGNVPKMVGRFPLSDYDNAQKSQRRGETFVLPDIRSAGESNEHAAFLAVGVQALIGVPLHKDGRWVASLSVHQGSPRAWSPEDAALVSETAERTWAAVTRARAEAALAESEVRYRRLFTSMDEGYAVVEVMADETGAWNDFLFLEVNPAFEKQTGMVDSVGRKASEILKMPNPNWAQIYGRVAETGEPVRLEQNEETLERIFDLYCFRLGGEGSRRVAVLFTDVTSRKRTEANLAFLAEVSQDLVRLTNVDETMNLLGEKIARHFNASVCGFSVIDEAAGTFTNSHVWHRAGVPSILGTFRLDDYHGEEIRRAMRAGETYVVRDTANDPRTNAANMAALGTGAFLTVPLVRDGEWRFNLTIVDHAPRAWWTDEIELMRELANRIWTRLERVRAEEALRKSEGRLRALVENLPGGAVFIVDKNLRYLVAQGEALTTAGFKPHDLIGRTINEAMPPELAPEYESLYRIALAGEEFEREHAAHDRTFVSRGVPLTSADNEIYAVLAISYDITDRKRAEEALRESEMRFRAIVNQSTAGVSEMDLAGNHTLVNNRFCEMLGYTEAELLGMNMRDYTHPEDLPRNLEIFERAVATGEPSDNEKRIIHKDGSLIWIKDSVAAIADAGGKPRHVAAIAIDITKRKQAEDELLRARDELERRVRERTSELMFANDSLQDEIIERAAAEERVKNLLKQLVTVQEDERRRIARDLHDHLGQQLTALQINLELLKGDCGESEKLCEQVSRTQQVARQLDSDIDFLAWELRPAALDDLGIVAALANYLQEWSKHFSIPADFHTRKLEKARLMPAVETNLYRIAQEALNNISKHARASRVDVLLEQRDGHAVLIVEDDGIGFDQDAVATPDREDKGMGLVGMRERAALVGGTLQIETASGGGTTVFVRVPVSHDADGDSEA